MAVSAKDVMELRRQTDCGMMECKKALVKADGDINKAIEILREEGLATAAKKAFRASSTVPSPILQPIRASTSAGFCSATTLARSLVNSTNLSFLATKSVSALTSTTTAPLAVATASMKLLLSRSSLSLARILQCRSLLRTRAT